MEIHFLEIPKRQQDGTPITRWLNFFVARTEEAFMELARTNPAMEQAWGVIKHLSGDERERALAEAREKARRDHAATIAEVYENGMAKGMEQGVAKGMEQGMAEGMTKGMAQGQSSIIHYMLTHGHTADEISTLTGLPSDVVLQVTGKEGGQ